MRGKGFALVNRVLRVGITPAHAGKSFKQLIQRLFAQDHPRACGEKCYRAAKGLPGRRITPAHAGKSV